MIPYSVVSPSVVLFSELDEVLDKLSQGPSVPQQQQQQQRVTDTTDTSGEETDTSQPRRRVRSKRTFKMGKSYATSELARFFVTGPTNASTKLNEFYCRLCRKDVSVLTHGSPEVFRHFRGIRHFARDQRGCDSRVLGGVSLGSTASLLLKTSWRGSVRKFYELP